MEFQWDYKNKELWMAFGFWLIFLVVIGYLLWNFYWVKYYWIFSQILCFLFTQYFGGIDKVELSLWNWKNQKFIKQK